MATPSGRAPPGSAWQGDFGSTTLGRTTNQFFVSTLIFNAFGDSFGYSPSIRQVLTPTVQHPQLLAFLGDTGWSNSILYTSPKFGGFSFNLQGALGEGAAGATGAQRAAATCCTSAARSPPPWPTQQVKHGVSGFTPAIQRVGFDEQDSVQVGAVVRLHRREALRPVQPGQDQGHVDTESDDLRHRRLGPAGRRQAAGPVRQWPTAEFPTTEVENKTLTVGYDYFLSKRTDIYAVVVNDKFTNLATGNTIALGLKHKF